MNWSVFRRQRLVDRLHFLPVQGIGGLEATIERVVGVTRRDRAIFSPSQVSFPVAVIRASSTLSLTSSHVDDHSGCNEFVSADLRIKGLTICKHLIVLAMNHAPKRKKPMEKTRPTSVNGWAFVENHSIRRVTVRFLVRHSPEVGFLEARFVEWKVLDSNFLGPVPPGLDC